MFLRYYGLHEQPFGMTPDPRFLYLSASHREALASLIYGIESGRGFVGLIAEPGMGKTTVLFQLMERLRSSARTVFLFQTQGGTREFLCNLIADLGLDPGDRDVGSLQRELNEILIHEAQLGRQFVLIIDEAQNLDDPVLESVRMLSNFETPRSKLMQIILSAQPALAEKLARPELEQLKQRVSILCRLSPFTEEEVVDYVGHRLETAGYKGGQLFTHEALAMIAERSEGIPRNINNLCFHALSLGFAKGQKKIDSEIVAEVLSDLKLDTFRTGRQNPPVQDAGVRRWDSALEGVTINSRGRIGQGRTPFRNSGHFSTFTRRAGVRGRRRIRNGFQPWLFWVLTLLTLVLAGEMFWAYLPAGTSSHAIAHLIDNTIGHAKQAASKYNPLKTKGSPASTEPETVVIHPADSANNLPESHDASSLEPRNSVDSAPGKANSAAPPDMESPAPADNGSISSADANPVPISVNSSPEEPEDQSAVDSGSSEELPKGKIVVESNVMGSAITINGRTDPNWRTPHEFDLPEGSYRISVSEQGYSTWFKEVRITAGRKRWLTADLQLPRGVIVIDTEPPGMQVFIDGKAYGPSEVDAALRAGTHTFRVIPPGGRRPVEGSFVLKPGDVLTRKIRWLPSAGQPSADNKPDAKELRKRNSSSRGREQS